MKPFEKCWESSSNNDQSEVAISFSHSDYGYYSLEPKSSAI